MHAAKEEASKKTERLAQVAEPKKARVAAEEEEELFCSYSIMKNTVLKQNDQIQVLTKQLELSNQNSESLAKKLCETLNEVTQVQEQLRAVNQWGGYCAGVFTPAQPPYGNFRPQWHGQTAAQCVEQKITQAPVPQSSNRQVTQPVRPVEPMRITLEPQSTVGEAGDSALISNASGPDSTAAPELHSVVVENHQNLSLPHATAPAYTSAWEAPTAEAPTADCHLLGWLERVTGYDTADDTSDSRTGSGSGTGSIHLSEVKHSEEQSRLVPSEKGRDVDTLESAADWVLRFIVSPTIRPEDSVADSQVKKTLGLLCAVNVVNMVVLSVSLGFYFDPLYYTVPVELFLGIISGIVAMVTYASLMQGWSPHLVKTYYFQWMVLAVMGCTFFNFHVIGPVGLVEIMIIGMMRKCDCSYLQISANIVVFVMLYTLLSACKWWEHDLTSWGQHDVEMIKEIQGFNFAMWCLMMPGFGFTFKQVVLS